VPRMTEIVGKPVLTAETGDRLGRIEDLLLGPDRVRVDAVLVGTDWRSWLGQGRVLLLEDVQVLGEVAIVTKDAAPLAALSEWRDSGHTVHLSSAALKGKRVITNNGNCVGMVKDAIVDTQTGRVEQLEVVEREAGRLKARRSLVPVTPEVRIGDDLVVVPEEQRGGVTGDAGRDTPSEGEPHEARNGNRRQESGHDREWRAPGQGQ
jgi:sporulation protein YlmC with PRC-barrel domain